MVVAEYRCDQANSDESAEVSQNLRNADGNPAAAELMSSWQSIRCNSSDLHFLSEWDSLAAAVNLLLKRALHGLKAAKFAVLAFAGPSQDRNLVIGNWHFAGPNRGQWSINERGMLWSRESVTDSGYSVTEDDKCLAKT